MISFRLHAGIWKNCYEGSDWKGRVLEGTMKKLGTFSFLPNRNIWLAATIAAAVLCAALFGIFRMSGRKAGNKKS